MFRFGQIRPAVFAAGSALLLAGCMIPPHRLPHGFSSSYHRHLYGMEPVVIGGVPQDAYEPNHSPGVFFPSRIELSAPPSASVADPAAKKAAKPAPISIPPVQAAKKSSFLRRGTPDFDFDTLRGSRYSPALQSTWGFASGRLRVEVDFISAEFAVQGRAVFRWRKPVRQSPSGFVENLPHEAPLDRFNSRHLPCTEGR
jgi:hypothetical protein